METIQLWTILFLFVAGQGLLLGLLFLTGKKFLYPPNRYLSAFVWVQTLIILVYVVYWNNWQFHWIHLNFLLVPLPFLLGPLLWFYFQALLERKWTWIDVVHFLPFLLVTAYFSPFYLLDTVGKYEFFKNSFHLEAKHLMIQKVFQLGTYLSLTAYTLYFFYFLKQSTISIQKTAKNKKPLPESVYQCLQLLSQLFAIYTLSYYIYFVLIGIMGAAVWVDCVIALVGSTMIFAIGWMGFNRPALFRQREQKAIEKYKQSSLSPNLAQQLEQRLYTFFETEKPYLDEQFNLNILASKTAIPKHHLSELFNAYMKISFNDFVNQHRVKHAQNLLANGAAQQLTLQAIGFDSGFNSRSTFYKAFKKMTGMTPSQYRKKGKRPLR